MTNTSKFHKERTTTCAHCSASFVARGRGRYCSAKCRIAASRATPQAKDKRHATAQRKRLARVVRNLGDVIEANAQTPTAKRAAWGALLSVARKARAGQQVPTMAELADTFSGVLKG